MNMTFKSLVAGIALFTSACAVVVGLSMMTERASLQSFVYLIGGAVVCRFAWRALVPRRYREEATR